MIKQCDYSWFKNCMRTVNVSRWPLLRLLLISQIVLYLIINALQYFKCSLCIKVFDNCCHSYWQYLSPSHSTGLSKFDLVTKKFLEILCLPCLNCTWLNKYEILCGGESINFLENLDENLNNLIEMSEEKRLVKVTDQINSKSHFQKEYWDCLSCGAI